MRWMLAAILGLVSLTPSAAHPLNWTRVSVSKDTTQARQLIARLEVDLAKFVGGYSEYHRLAVDPAGEPVLRAAANRALSELSLVVAGQTLPWRIEELIPPSDPEDFFSTLPAPMTFIRASATLPDQPTTPVFLRVSSAATLELPIVLRGLEVDRDGPLLLNAGADVALRASAPLGAAKPAPTGGRSLAMRQVAGTYLLQGFRHILPLGLDHILFVLSLYFAGTRPRELWLQISTFTAAHTLTLGAATFGLVSVPSRPVEVLIAASILWLAVENLSGRPPGRSRYGLVFGFGLLHGLGFAAALNQLGLPRDSLLLSLFCFNVGVELGQLAVLTSAFLLVGWWRSAARYHSAVVQPASAAIAAVAVCWIVQRTLFS